jgi:hypothetical protein
VANPRLAPQYYQRNAITYQAHRRQVIWQIYLPIALVILLVILAGILVILAPTFKVERWADIALILLISTTMISALVFIILVIFSIIGTRRFLLIVPYYLFMGQSYAFRLRNRSRDLSDRAVEPILWTNSNIAKFQAIRPKKQ